MCSDQLSALFMLIRLTAAFGTHQSIVEAKMHRMQRDERRMQMKFIVKSARQHPGFTSLCCVACRHFYYFFFIQQSRAALLLECECRSRGG